MKKLILSAFVAVFALFGVSEAQAQGIQFGAAGAYGFGGSANFDAGPGIEGRIALPIEAGFGDLKATGNFGYHFPDDIQTIGGTASFTYWEINGNLAYMFETGGSVAPYAGAGLNYANLDFDVAGFTGGGSEIGFNLLGGAEFSAGGLTPFVEGAFQLSGGEQIMLKGGLLFGG